MIKMLEVILNALVLILSLFIIIPDSNSNPILYNWLCIIIIVLQALSIFGGIIYQNLLERKTFKKIFNVKSKKELLEKITPYKSKSILGDREEMRQSLIILTIVFIFCCIYWAFLSNDPLKFIMVISLICIAFIYADYVPHNIFYSKVYDEMFIDGNDTPKSIRGLARIYIHEYEDDNLGFKRLINSKGYKALSQYDRPEGENLIEGIQDKCIKHILFSKADAIKNTEIYFSAAIMFFNIFLVIPKAADIVIERILPFDHAITMLMMTYILIAINVIFAVINIHALSTNKEKCETISNIASAMLKSGKEGVIERYNCYETIRKDFDFALIQARGIYVFNSIGIDNGKNLDNYLDDIAANNEKDDKKAYLKYRMLYTHKFVTNLHRFGHTVILSYIALLCLLLDLHVEYKIVGHVFVGVTIAVIVFGFFVFPNIGRIRISKAIKELINQSRKNSKE